MSYRCDEDAYFLLEYFDIRMEWDYWAGRPVLLASEAIPLMHGVDPKTWREHLLNEKGLPDDIAQSIDRCLRVAENTGIEQYSPADWIEWGRRHKLNEHTVKPDFTMNTGEVCLWHFFEIAVNRASLSVGGKEHQLKPVRVQQEEGILNAIKEIGHDPRKLPKRENGKSGIKSKVWGKIEARGLFNSKKTFDNRWQELRDSQNLKEID